MNVRIFFIIALILCFKISNAVQERFYASLEGSQVATNGFITHSDDKYFEMLANPNWSSLFSNFNVTNRIKLEINPEVTTLISSNFTATCSLTVTHFNSAGSQTIVNPVVLTVSYDINTGAMITDQNVYEFTKGHLVRVKINSITSSIPNVLRLSSEIIVNRIYTLDRNNLPGGFAVQSQILNDPINEYELKWPMIYGAEEYDLEYVFINDYDGETGYISASQINYDFTRNSTRVTVKENFYRVPNTFGHGYLLYRIRPVGRYGTNFAYRMEGKWSALGSGKISDITSKVATLPLHSDSLNWSYNASYIEGGKRFDMISYADGLGMSRQQIAKNNTDSLAIVQVTYYDHHGRAALSSLPAPSSQPNLKYRFRWNRPTDSSLVGFSKYHFDKEQTECVVTPSSMHTTYGAGNYYSTANSYTTGYQAYVPNAEGYPFVQIQYMPDGTGRASRIGSAGPEFQINDPHSVSMEYGSATQQRLNQLFGTDAGYEVQYQKNIIVDGNGQRVVSYLDGSGRVVATALAGEAPSNVMALNTNTVTNVQTPIIEPGDDAQNSSTPGELNFESVITVDVEGEHIFSYGISPGTMANECHPELCMDCVYDLEFTITDVLCGEVIYTLSKTINGAALDNSCNGLALDSIGTSVIAVDLVPGSYQISKKLKVNQASLEYYLAQYLELNTCLLDYSDFLEQALADANTSGCNSTPCILSCIQSLGTREAYIALGNTGAQWDVLFAACLNDCEATSTAYCDNFRQSMLDDVKPNGQYGLVTFSAGTYSSTDPLSVYYVSNDLPNTNAYWRNPVGGYKNSDGSTSYILNSSNVLVTPEHASITLTEFINAFQDSWADALLPYHPEYCYLSFCVSQEASHQSDMLMLGIQTYDEAKTLGYLNPLLMNSAQGVPTNAQSASTFVDPFFTNNPGIQSQFINEMRNYQSFNGVNYTIWQMAWFLTYCNGDTTVSGMTTCLTGFNEFGTNACTKDLLWETFRDLYLELKSNIYSDLQARYAIENKCYSGCFGTTAFNDDAHDFDCYNASISPTCSGTKYDADQDPLQPCSDFTVALYSGKIPIFADRRQSPYYGLNTGALSTLVNGQITTFQGDFCETMCEQKIEEWMQDLSECGLTTPQYNAIKAEFLELCELGCDAQHASGASSLPTGVYTTGGNQSIHEILIDVLGSGYETAVCSELLINDVQPYGIVPDFQETYKLDTCGCDKVLYIKQLFLSGQPLPPGITSMDQLFAYTYGTPLTGVKNFACRCESAWTAGYPSTPYHPSLPWLSASATYLSTTTPYLYIPSGVACPSCVNCETINGLVSSFHTRFAGLSSTHSNYGTLLATYINNALGYQLSSDEYLDFIEACGQESTVPNCNPTQELHDLQNLLYSLSTLPSGGFLTTSSNPVLMSNLSIWAGSTLAGYTAGSTEQYWTNYGSNGTNPDQSPLTLSIGNGSPCTIVLTLTSGSTNRWSKLADIKNLTFVQNGCTSSYQFSATATFSTPGGWVTETIYGTTSCYPMATCVCGENLKLCNEFNFVPTIDPCVQTVLNTAEANAQSAYEEYMEGIIAEFTANYLSVCIGAAANSEYLNWSYPSNEYHYTLYYYDQAGQLVRTVPPKGVDGTFTASGVDANRPSGSRIAPSHTLTTEYRYNSFGQVVEQKTPDGGVSKFWYDKFGRIAVSQNAKQAPGYYYSYTRYDIYGRPFEVGQVQKSAGTQISEAIVKNPSSLDTWITSGTRTEVTRTTYDRSISVSVVASKFTNGQNHLRNRISTVAHYFSYPATTDLDFNHATHFSYDDHGNVTEMIQDMPALGPIQHQYKKIQYVFEQISGNVKKVLYQKGSADQFLHEYFYDADNRIKEVYTSRDSTIWDRDAKYFYYRHGPLARVEHGHNKVQGEDFAYTINGWIKGVNSGTLNTTYDMGKDGVTGYLSGNTNVHNRVAYDKFGYVLGYFNQDYKPVSGATPGNYFEPAYSGTGFGNASPSLYNGNIRHMITAIPTASNQVMGYAYQYDQLNRIKSMNAFRFVSGNSWSTGTSTTDYQTSYSYDANGNILSLNRKGQGMDMDQLSYTYLANSNQLGHVDDGVNPGNYSDDIDDQSPGNYTYTATGELKSDAQENIADITWRVDGKVRRVTRNTASKVEMEFEYDAFGRRVLKIEKPTTTGGSPVGQDQWTYTYYVNDASGNVMATYKLTKGVTTETFKLENQHIYGSKRLGMLVRDYTLTTRNVSTGINTHSAAEARNHRAGRRYYEYSNHLGNVLLVTSDRKIPYYSGSTFLRYEPQMISFSDYYPFGMLIPGRVGNPTKYNFGYQGQEEEDNLNGIGNGIFFSYRIHDPRIGRFFSTDPMSNSFPFNSPYAFSENRVIDGVDLEGREFKPAGKSPSLFRSVPKADFNDANSLYFNVNFVQRILIMTKEVNPSTPPDSERINSVKSFNEKHKIKTKGDHTSWGPERWVRVTKMMPGAGKSSTNGAEGISDILNGAIWLSNELMGINEQREYIKEEAIYFQSAFELMQKVLENGYLPQELSEDTKVRSDLLNYLYDGSLPFGIIGYGDEYIEMIKIIGDGIYENRNNNGRILFNQMAFDSNIPLKGLDRNTQPQIIIRELIKTDYQKSFDTWKNTPDYRFRKTKKDVKYRPSF